MPGSFECLEPHLAELDHAAVRQRSEPVFRFGPGAKIDRCAGAVAEFQMSRDKIGMQMCQENMLDLQVMIGGKGQVLRYVALRVDNGGGSCGFITD